MQCNTGHCRLLPIILQAIYVPGGRTVLLQLRPLGESSRRFVLPGVVHQCRMSTFGRRPKQTALSNWHAKKKSGYKYTASLSTGVLGQYTRPTVGILNSSSTSSIYFGCYLNIINSTIGPIGASLEVKERREAVQPKKKVGEDQVEHPSAVEVHEMDHSGKEARHLDGFPLRLR